MIGNIRISSKEHFSLHQSVKKYDYRFMIFDIYAFIAKRNVQFPITINTTRNLRTSNFYSRNLISKYIIKTKTKLIMCINENDGSERG